MKKLSLISLIFIALSSVAFAMPVLVKHVEISPLITTFELEVAFCSNVHTKDFEVQAVTTLNNETTVGFLFTGFDCHGPTHRQTVKLTTTQIPFRSQIFVKNPLLVSEKDTR